MDAAAGGVANDAAEAEFAALRDAMSALGATSLHLVYRSTLRSAEVSPYQSRLLIPCRDGAAGIGNTSALTAFLTADEEGRVRGADRGAEVETPWNRRSSFPDRRELGIEVPAYDRHGRRFNMRLTWTRSSSCYRFGGGGWLCFLRQNQVEEAMAAAKEMGREVEVDLWVFRSTKLLPERRAEGHQQHHPDGALGVVILIRNRG